MRGAKHRGGVAAMAVAAALIVGARAGGVEDDASEAAEVAALRRRVVYLSKALAASRIEADRLRARLDGRDAEAEENVVADGISVADVNRELGMIVVNAGRRQGVRPGMRFAVVRNSRPLARVRVVDVRSDVAGAVVESAGRGAQPAVQDRLIRVSGPEE